MPNNGNPYFGATFAERKAARLSASPAPVDEPDQKAVHADEVEDKAVTSGESKARKAPVRKAAARKKG